VREIENKIVLDSHWRALEQPEPQVFGECAGCQEDIIEGDAYYEIELNHDVTEMVHQKQSCCMDYVSNMSYCRTAGEY
jgi:hypothetical protein